MLRIENMKLLPGASAADLAAEAARQLNVKEKDITALHVLRRSIDAREGVRMVYTVEVKVKEEEKVIKRCRNKRVSQAHHKVGYLLPLPQAAPQVPPIVVGAGPAGLFAALVLAKAGLKTILLERGR